MRAARVETIVFSSTAAVYGMPRSIPVTEDEPLAPIHPYGESKRMSETILADYGRAHEIKWAALHYFNAFGADHEGELGPNHEPITHLIPLVLRAALGTGPSLTVFGTDYQTPDGTVIRDYIHVDDLATAHVAALGYLSGGGASDVFILGAGHGYSVQDVIDTTAQVLDTVVPTVNGARRAGDAPALVADPGKAKSAFGWRPQHSSLESIIATAAAWERKRPIAR